MRFLSLLAVLFSFFPLHGFASVIGDSIPLRKKVAVVLSGGGARGMAHIGALKVIEEAGIPIDYIVGTSMGSIIGGLYSIGYTSAQLDSMVRKQDWNFLFSDRVRRYDAPYSMKEQDDKFVVTLPIGKKIRSISQAGLIKGQNLENLFFNLTFGYHDSIDFNRLPIPYACVAADVVTGKEYVFHDGVLPVAMRASMAIPAVFSPVRKDSMLLIDGGFVNNYPVDVARAMGADVVIGVDVQAEAKGVDELRATSDVLGQLIDLYGRKKYKENIANTDVYVKVNVKGFSPASFSSNAIDTLIIRGEDVTRSLWSGLIGLKEKIGVDSSYSVVRAPCESLEEQQSFYVNSITFAPLERSDESSQLLKLSRLKENRFMSINQLQNAISRFYATELFDGVSYKLIASKEKGYDLHFEFRKKQENLVRAGVRFDSEEVASALLAVSLKMKTPFPSTLTLTGRLGRRSLARADYTIRLRPACNINVAYMFQYNDINIYNKGARAYNVTYAYNFGEFALMGNLGTKFKYGLGLHVEAFDYKGVLINTIAEEQSVESDEFLSYFAYLYYDTFNKRYFPSKGSMMKLDYSMYTDNMVTYKDGAPFSAFSFVWRTVFPVTKHLALLPSVHSRILIGHNVAYPYYNMLGGDVSSRYFPQQLPFAGINNVEFCKKAVVIAGINFRYRIGKNNYVSLIGNYGMEHDKLGQILGEGSKALVGGSIGYGYDSMLGPLEFSFNFSNRTEKLGYYLNIGFVF